MLKIYCVFCFIIHQSKTDSHSTASSGKEDLAKAKFTSANFIHVFLNQQRLPLSEDAKVIVMTILDMEP